MRLTSLVFVSSFILAACSTAEQAESSASATLSGSGSTSVSSHSSGTEGGTDHGTSTSGQSATTGAGTASATGDWSTGGSTTGAGTTGSLDTETGTGTTGSMTTATGTTTETSSGTTTGGVGGPCVVDADCKLHDDCCSCSAIPADQDDEICDLECDQSSCAAMGIDQAVCRFGVCTLEKFDCAGPVDCNSSPPDCGPNHLPSIENGCWTGKCVPGEACNRVPNCALCPDSFMCVEYQAWVLEHACEPIPADCEGAPNCECAGPHACTGGFDLCNEAMGDNDLICVCPNC